MSNLLDRSERIGEGVAGGLVSAVIIFVVGSNWDWKIAGYLLLALVLAALITLSASRILRALRWFLGWRIRSQSVPLFLASFTLIFMLLFVFAYLDSYGRARMANFDDRQIPADIFNAPMTNRSFGIDAIYPRYGVLNFQPGPTVERLQEDHSFWDRISGVIPAEKELEGISYWLTIEPMDITGRMTFDFYIDLKDGRQHRTQIIMSDGDAMLDYTICPTSPCTDWSTTKHLEKNIVLNPGIAREFGFRIDGKIMEFSLDRTVLIRTAADGDISGWGFALYDHDGSSSAHLTIDDVNVIYSSSMKDIINAD